MSNLPVNIRTVQPGPEPRRILSIVQHGLHSSETTSSASPARRRLRPPKPRSRLTARSPAANRGRPQMQSLGYK